MGNRKKNSVPVSMRVAFISFIVLGLLVTGYLMMVVNQMRAENDELERVNSMQKEVNESLAERNDAEMDDEYIKELAREEGYIEQGEQFYPIDNEE